MTKVLTISRTYPNYHPRAGELTHFVEKIMASLADSSNSRNGYWKMNKDFIDYDWCAYYNCRLPKGHTIRAGHRFKAGDMISLRVWSNDVNPKSGRSGPYHSKQIIIAPDIEVKKTWDFELHGGKAFFKVDGLLDEITDEQLEIIARNDGLSLDDFGSWFSDFSIEGEYQIICWDEKINY